LVGTRLPEDRAVVSPPAGLAAFGAFTQGVARHCQRPPALPFGLHFVQAFSLRSNRFALGWLLSGPLARRDKAQ
jgi:hypothetical protein